MTTLRKLIPYTLAKIGDELPFNSLLPVQWLCHDKKFIRRALTFDHTATPHLSGGILKSWIEAIMDIQDNSSKHTLPTLILTAGKDKFVDNKGAREFFKNIKTPSNLKQIKLFYNGYH